MSSTIIIQEPVKPQVTIKDGDNVVRVETVIPGEGAGSGAGDVLKSGSPSANQSAVWASSSAIRGSATLGVNDTTGVVSLALGASNNAFLSFTNVGSRPGMGSTTAGQGVDIRCVDASDEVRHVIGGSNALVSKAAQTELAGTNHELLFSSGVGVVRCDGATLDIRNLTAILSLEDSGSGNPRIFPATGNPNLNIGKASSTNAVDLRADVRVGLRAGNASLNVETFRYDFSGSVPIVFTGGSGARIDVPSASEFKITRGGADRIVVDTVRTAFAGAFPARLPRLTTAQRNALSALEGDVIQNTDTNKAQVYDGTVWQDMH